jgi:hypothetical protein
MQYLQRPEEGVGPGSGVTGGCESPDVGAETEFKSSVRIVHTLHHTVISLPLLHFLWGQALRYLLYQDEGANYKRADMGEEEEETNTESGRETLRPLVQGDSRQAGSWRPVRPEQVRRVQMPHLRVSCFGLNAISSLYSYADS